MIWGENPLFAETPIYKTLKKTLEISGRKPGAENWTKVSTADKATMALKRWPEMTRCQGNEVIFGLLSHFWETFETWNKYVWYMISIYHIYCGLSIHLESSWRPRFLFESVPFSSDEDNAIGIGRPLDSKGPNGRYRGFVGDEILPRYPQLGESLKIIPSNEKKTHGCWGFVRDDDTSQLYGDY